MDVLHLRSANCAERLSAFALVPDRTLWYTKKTTARPAAYRRNGFNILERTIPMRQKIAAFLAAAMLAGTVCPARAAAAEQDSAVTFRPSDVVTDVSALLDGAEGKTPVETIVELSGTPALSAPEEERSARRADIAAEQDALLAQIAALTGTDGLTAEHRYSMTVNAVAVTVPYDALDDIRALDGVASVHPAERFAAPDSTGSTQTVTTGKSMTTLDMVGADTAWAAGYDGAGTVVAIIDTGLDTDHPAFETEPDPDTASLDRAAVAEVLDGLNAAGEYTGLTAEDVYLSGKIPFAFNYADKSTDVTHENDRQGDHGTHVAGIIGADGPDSDVVGLAPKAQLLIMKVFGNSDDSASETMLLAALEDAVLLGAEVINMSLGTPAGFSGGTVSYIKALDAAADAGVIVCAAAGNDYSSAYGNASGTNLSTTENIDVGTVNDPASLNSVLAVASVNSAWALSDGVTLASGDFVAVSDQGASFGLRRFASLTEEKGCEDGKYEFAVVPGTGREEDFTDIDVSGKIAVIRRGEIPFTEKYDNACAAGAVAVIICNNEDTTVLMDLSGAGEYDCPCVLAARENGQRLIAAAGEDGTGKLTVAAEPRSVNMENGWRLSDFSSWGALSDLTLKPDLAAVGGNVYSTRDDGTYGELSGTSMASPQLAAMSAVTLQYVREEFGLDAADARDMVQNLLMNTAIPMSQTDGVKYSPRKQGAGLANVGGAVTTPVLLTVKGSVLPKAELGSDQGRSGIYRFTFTARNLTDEPHSYVLSADLLTETAEDGVMLQHARALDASVTYSGADGGSSADGAATVVTVPAGDETEVTVTVRLSEQERRTLLETFTNGVYVEGYISLKSAEEGVPALTVPMLAFFGDWSRAPLFERTYAAEYDALDNTDDDLTGNSAYPFEIVTGDDCYLGMNPVAADQTYIPARSNALNPDGGEGSVIENVILDLYRNARSITVDVLDRYGASLYRSTAEYVRKSVYMESIGGLYPAVWTDYAEDFSFDPLEYGLKNGDAVTIRITGEKDAEGSYRQEVITVPAYIDGAAPSVQAVRVDREPGGSCCLTVTAQDNCYIAGFLVLSADGSTVLGRYAADQRVRGAQVSAELDVTDVIPVSGGKFLLCAMDYARNTALYEVNVLQDGESTILPDGALYAYYSDFDGQGWYKLKSEGGQAESAFLDYLGGITAAETVGNYIFAASGGKIYAVDTAAFQPTEVCGLGLDYSDEIVDLTYRPADGLLYALVRTGERYTLFTVDPATEETEKLAEVDKTILSGFGAAAALACGPDGALYLLAGREAENGKETLAIYRRDDVSGWQLRKELGLTLENAELSAVFDGDTLYFTCYRKSQENPDDVSARLYAWTAENGLSEVGELPALPFDALVLTGGTDAEFPADGAVTEATLNAASRHLERGAGFTLTVEDIRPWFTDGKNYRVSWTSSDETVAAVDAWGNVTARSEGTAEITATLSRQGRADVTARCTVTVEPGAQLHALGADGTWVTLDVKTFREPQAEETQFIADASAAAYAVSAGPDGQDVIFTLDSGKTSDGETCQAYILYTYDAGTRALLDSRELTRTWFVSPEQMPENGFRDLAYDPASGYLVAVAGQCLFAIDVQHGRFYMAADASEQLGDAEFAGLAFDSGGSGWYVDSLGGVGEIRAYLGAADIGKAKTALPAGGEMPELSSMEYDELSGRLWVVWDGRLYGLERGQSGYTITRSIGIVGGASCLFTRHWPEG